MSTKLRFRRLAGTYAICRLPPDAPFPAWAERGTLTSITRTAEELSIVCPLENVPAEHRAGIRWCCFQLVGPFAFSQVGILASFIAPLAASGIPIFAISTYDTDYVLVSGEFADAARKSLLEAGHEFVSES